MGDRPLCINAGKANRPNANLYTSGCGRALLVGRCRRMIVNKRQLMKPESVTVMDSIFT